MLGVGGGFLIVPAFRRYTNVDMQGIVATSLMLIALVSAVAVVSALGQGIHITRTGWIFVAAAVAGMSVGRVIAPHLPARLLQIGFAALTTVVACTLLVQFALSHALH